MILKVNITFEDTFESRLGLPSKLDYVRNKEDDVARLYIIITFESINFE